MKGHANENKMKTISSSSTQRVRSQNAQRRPPRLILGHGRPQCPTVADINGRSGAAYTCGPAPSRRGTMDDGASDRSRGGWKDGARLLGDAVGPHHLVDVTGLAPCRSCASRKPPPLRTLPHHAWWPPCFLCADQPNHGEDQV